MLIKCPECKKQVSDSASSCPHCGYQLEEFIENLNRVKATLPKKNYTGFIIILVIIASIIAYFYYIGEKDTGSSSSSSYPSHNNLLAYNYAEDFVKERLKSPSTAEFPGLSDRNKHSVGLGMGKYKINSWVDSQNSFGATIRTKFSCEIVFEGNNVLCRNLVFNE